MLENGEEHEVARNSWRNIRYSYNEKKKRIEEEELGSFIQYPMRLAWAITVHKSQGGEFSTVIIPLLKEHYVMLRRNLLYTAISRAKKKVILIGQRQAVYMAIHKNDVDKRNTVLADRITVYFDRANNVRAS